MTLVLVMKNYLLPTLEAGNAKSGPMQVATCQLGRGRRSRWRSWLELAVGVQ